MAVTSVTYTKRYTFNSTRQDIGYELARATDQITILDVVNAVGKLQRIRSCPLGLKTHTSLCPLHAELDRAYETTESAFAAVTMKQLLESTSSIVPLCESQ